VLNVTVVNGTAPLSYIAIYPAPSSGAACSSIGLGTSNLNFTTNQIIANRVSATVGAGGSVCIYNNLGSVDVVVDLVGWYSSGQSGDTSGGAYVPQNQVRIYDSRSGRTPLAAGTTRDIGLSRSAQYATAVNLTITNVSASGFLQMYPSGSGANDATSDINFAAGDIRSDMAIAHAGANGAVTFFMAGGGSVDFLIDVYGTYAVV